MALDRLELHPVEAWDPTDSALTDSANKNVEILTPITFRVDVYSIPKYVETFRQI